MAAFSGFFHINKCYISASDKPFSFAGSGTQLFRNLKSGEDDDGNDDEVSYSYIIIITNNVRS